MIFILGLQLIVWSNIRLLIFLMCKIFFATLSVIRRPITPWDRSVAVLYTKWYPLKIIDVVSSFLRYRCSCMVITSILNVLYPVVSLWSLPGLNIVRTLQVENFRNWRDFSFDTLFSWFSHLTSFDCDQSKQLLSCLDLSFDLIWLT